MCYFGLLVIFFPYSQLPFSGKPFLSNIGYGGERLNMFMDQNFGSRSRRNGIIQWNLYKDVKEDSTY